MRLALFEFDPGRQRLCCGYTELLAYTQCPSRGPESGPTPLFTAVGPGSGFYKPEWEIFWGWSAWAGFAVVTLGQNLEDAPNLENRR